MASADLRRDRDDRAHADGACIADAFASGDPEAMRSVSSLAACLLPLLRGLGWQGEPRRIAEALPYRSAGFDADDLIAVTARLDYACVATKMTPRRFDARLLPCLLIRRNRAPLVVLHGREHDYEAYDGERCATISLRRADLRGLAYHFSPAGDEAARRTQARDGNWFADVLAGFRGSIWRMVGLAWMNSLLGLALPVFMLCIYDWIIPTGSTDMLFSLAAGMVLMLACDMALRMPRLRNLAFMGGRVDHQAGTQSFQQLLHLPAGLTNRASLGAQTAQLRQFDSLRDVFSGSVANVFLDAPFALVFFIALVWIGGDVAIIPAILCVVFVIAAVIVGPRMKRAAAEHSEARAQKQAFLTEMTMHLRAIKGLGGEPIWRRRYRELSARTALSGFRTAQLSALVQTMAQVLMTGAGFAVLTYGTMKVIAGEMSIGALIACMALVWRLLSPLQAGFVSIFKLGQLRHGVAQVNRLMRLQPEKSQQGLAGSAGRSFRGEVTFQRVSMRYNQHGEPALLGVDFVVAPRRVIAVTGPSGSGKSSLLELMSGLHQPQAGAVLIDRVDVRQMDRGQLRGTIAYVPQACHLFSGTVAENLRLAEPMASDAALMGAARDAGVLDAVEGLADGFDTVLDPQLGASLPAGFAQRLMLARAYLRQTYLYLFDEPTQGLDGEAEALFINKLKELRRRATVFVVTQRPELLRVADGVLHLDGGRLAFSGPPHEFLAHLASRER